MLSRLTSPLRSQMSPLRSEALGLSGISPPGPLLPTSMLFRESRTVLERPGRPLAGLGQALAYLLSTFSDAWRGGVRIYAVAGFRCSPHRLDESS